MTPEAASRLQSTRLVAPSLSWVVRRPPRLDIRLCQVVNADDHASTVSKSPVRRTRVNEKVLGEALNAIRSRLVDVDMRDDSPSGGYTTGADRSG